MNAEIRLLSLIDSERSSTGRIVKATFELHADDAEALRGRVGKRFGAALVEIGDDEKPMEKAKPNYTVMTAGRLCFETAFQTFCEQQYPHEWAATSADRTDADRAAIVVRQVCQVKSRKELATNPAAVAAFDHMIADYEMWKRGE